MGGALRGELCVMFKKLLTVAAFVVTTSVFGAVTAQPTSAASEVTICHATNSSQQSSNPYNQLTVSINAVDGVGNGNSDHGKHNDVAIAYSQAQHDYLKSHHINWGDIIPPVPGVIDNGLNWNDIGKAVYNNGCNYPKSATASVSTIAPTCFVGEKLVYNTATFATYSGTDNNTYGPGSYSVTATAASNALFFTNQGPKATLTFNGTLAGVSTSRMCVTAKEVTFINPTCVLLGSYTIPTASGVVYINGEEKISAGTYPAAAGTTVTINAVALEGYTITSSPTTWSHEFVAPRDCPTTPDQPDDIVTTNTSTDVNCTTKKHITTTTTSTTTYELVDNVWVAQEPVVVSAAVSRDATTDELAVCASDDDGDVLGDSTGAGVAELPNTNGSNTAANIIALVAAATIVTTLSVIARNVLSRRV